jgi:thiol:disulfide interchange protein
MKVLKPFWILLAICLLMVAFSYFNASGEGGPERIQWRTDFNSAAAEAKSSNKPLFLYFTATWCGPCQSLKHTTWASADVEKALSNFVPVKIDVDEHRDLAKQYPSDGIPHFVIAKDDGTKLRETVGAYPPKEFIDWLDGKTM